MDITQILIGLALLGIFGGFTYSFFSRKKEREDKRQTIENNFKGQEKKITKIVRDYMNINIPVIIVRSPDTKIPHFSGMNWKQIETERIGQSAKAFYTKGRVYVRKYELEDSSKEITNEIYFKLLVHEFNHHFGYMHRPEMTAEDIRLIGEIGSILKEKSLI